MEGGPQVQRGSLVLDPFVGTGSMLVAAAAVGAVTVGADIDMRVIRLGKVLLAIYTDKKILAGAHRVRNANGGLAAQGPPEPH